jgi:hypothetical protein
VNMEMNIQVPYKVGKFLSGSTSASFSGMAQLHGAS